VKRATKPKSKLSIVEQVAALDTAPTDELIDEYTRLHSKSPRTRNRAWLVRKVAWAIQAEAYGGLSDKAKARLEELIAQIGPPLGAADRTVTTALPRKPKPNAPPVGTTLTRVWRGHQIIVHCRDNGYEHEGVLYRSLTAVAEKVTSSHWNGRLFFGLVDRRKKAS
jgi:hypothetical protein